MSVLICKNISTEGPGTIEDYLNLERIPYTIIDLSAGESMPDTARFDTLIMLGGPMSVNDDLRYIREEEDLVRDFAAEGRRMLGICLGAQIMAKAMGAKIYKGSAPEIGWYDIKLTEEGAGDPIMERLASDPDSGGSRRMLKVFHWHGETFDIPDGALRLASSELCPNQAFRLGASSYAFQFHIEVNEKIIYDWMAGENIDMAGLKADTERNYNSFRKRAFVFYKHFFQAVNN
jgi:GMP synthase (glutamine-hydrolysing)